MFTSTLFRMIQTWSLTRSGIWHRMRRWSNIAAAGFICREAGCIQERRVGDETDNLHGDGDVGGREKGNHGGIIRRAGRRGRFASICGWTWSRKASHFALMESRWWDAGSGIMGAAWNFMHWERRIHIARWQMASIRFQILAVRRTGPQSVSKTVPH